MLHAHDWHASLAPVFLRTRFSASSYHGRLSTVLAVHNGAYQGRFPVAAMADLGLPSPVLDPLTPDGEGRVAWLELGLLAADGVTTVSPTHAAELATPLGGFGLDHRFTAIADRLTGVVNGIDLESWNPAADPVLAARFDADRLEGRAACRAALARAYGFDPADPRPVVALVARLVAQKGIDLLLGGVLDRMPDLRFIVLGRGLPEYEQRLRDVAARLSDRVRVPLEFSDGLERQLLAGADVALVPSLFEPCGLVQMHAQRYGAVPVVRRVGGLADTVRDGETGFVFDDYSVAGVVDGLSRALAVREDRSAWETLVRRGMRAPRGWQAGVVDYDGVYARARRNRRSASAAAK